MHWIIKSWISNALFVKWQIKVREDPINEERAEVSYNETKIWSLKRQNHPHEWSINSHYHWNTSWLWWRREIKDLKCVCAKGKFATCRCAVHALIMLYCCSFSVSYQPIPVKRVEKHGMLINLFSIVTGVSLGGSDVVRSVSPALTCSSPQTL